MIQVFEYVNFRDDPFGLLRTDGFLFYRLHCAHVPCLDVLNLTDASKGAFSHFLYSLVVISDVTLDRWNEVAHFERNVLNRIFRGLVG
jgi:hypothetical protein